MTTAERNSEDSTAAPAVGISLDRRVRALGKYERLRQARLEFEAANRARQAWRAYVLMTDDELASASLTRDDMLSLARDMDEHCRSLLGLPALRIERSNVAISSGTPSAA